MSIPPGKKIRVKTNPERVGVAGDEFRNLGPLVRQQFIFPDSTQFLPVTDVEIVESDELDPYALLKERSFAGIKSLSQSFVFHRLNGALADILYSMDATHTDYYPFQYKPLLNFLDSPSQGLLIADEVGLGKTIEAGIIWTELRARYDHSCLLVVCPAVLTEKWQLELRLRFSIIAEICDAKELRQRLEAHTRGELESFAIICSVQGIRPPRRAKDPDVAGRSSAKLAEFFDEHRHERYLFDLVVVDEAHYMRNSESLARRLGTDLRDLSQNLLLLSATPIQMKSEDLFSQLSLLDPDTFVSVESFEEVLLANEPLNRLRDQVLRPEYTSQQYAVDLQETRNYPIIGSSRQLETLRNSIPSEDEFATPYFRSRIADQLERVNLLSHVVSRTRKRDVQKLRVIRRARPEFIQMSELEEHIYNSVTEEIKRFCASRPDLPEGFALSTPQRQISSSVPAAIINWRERGMAFERAEERYEYSEDESDSNREQFGPLVGKMVEIAMGIGDTDRLEQGDTKFKRLAQVLSKIYEDNSSEKLIIFSYFKPTLRYLERRLSSMGLNCQLLYGGMAESKHEVITRFRESDSLQILLSSEVASEGVDLQFCRIIINYDLPWNPMRIEQRIGRIDRIGQEADAISIWNLFYADTIDSRIYERLLSRLEIFERALGGVEAVLGDPITSLTNQLIREYLTPEEEEERIAQTEQAIATLRAQNERLENEASAMVAHADTILKQVSAVRDLHRYVQPRDLYEFVGGVLEERFPRSRLILKNEDELTCEIHLCTDAQYQFTQYLQNSKSKIRTGLLESRTPTRRYQFKTKSNNRARNTETITNFHPFVRFLSSVLTTSGIPNYPPVAVELPVSAHPKLVKGIFPFLVMKLTFEGTQTHEWLKFAFSELGVDGVELGDEAERLIGLAANQGANWLVAPSDFQTEELELSLVSCVEALEHDMSFQVKRLESENGDRVDLQARNVRRKFDREIHRENEVLVRLIAEGKTQGAQLRKGKIASLEAKKEKRLFELEKARDTKSDATRMVAVGVIRVI